MTITLGEGNTPLLQAPRLSERLGVDLWLKWEGANPTGSFKDRGMSVAVTRAVEDGATIIIGKPLQVAIGEQRLIAESFIPIRLQNNLAVHGCDNSIDHLTGCITRSKMETREGQCQRRYEKCLTQINFDFQNG